MFFLYQLISNMSSSLPWAEQQKNQIRLGRTESVCTLSFPILVPIVTSMLMAVF